MQIANITLKNNVIVAPLASITNIAFRMMLTQYQPGLIFNEMVSDEAINYRNPKTLKMLETIPGDHPIAFQLFGAKITSMVKAAQYLDQHTDCDIIDINMGCPVNKVVKQGKGSALLKDINYASELAYAIKQAIKKPLTVKMRIGYDTIQDNLVEFIHKLTQAGISAVTIHGRTRKQMYEGEANWEIIKQIKKQVSIPVIGNGDIRSVNDFKEKLVKSGVDGIMLGRAILKQPWLIQACHDENFQFTDEVTLRLANLEQHALNLIALLGETQAMKQMRSHAAWAISGLPHSRTIKEQLVRIQTKKEFDIILLQYKQWIKEQHYE